MATLVPRPVLDSESVEPDDGPQINVPPERDGGLWKIIVPAIRCPVCGSNHTKAITGKRSTSGGLAEHYHVCAACRVRFRVVYE
ncbi:MAG: hypothetical protein AAF805_06820 [Planctomycetota bacterium]